MVKVLFELLEFLRTSAPLLTSLAVLTLLAILLSRSIRKHAAIFYTLLAIPFVLVLLPYIGGWFGMEVPSFVRIPVLGEIVRDYIHMGTFGHPLLIIIMYMGALDMKYKNVKKLMSIRKELSIVSGFAVFTHSLIRVLNSVPGAFQFFANNEEYMANTKVASEIGAGFSSFSFLLGVLMLIIFIPLWVTSFDAIHRRMGQVRWKKLQRWSYVLYATLFIHAVGIQIGGMLNPRGGHAAKPAATVETVAQTRPAAAQSETARPATGEGRGEGTARRGQTANPSNTNRPGGQQVAQQTATRPATSGRAPTKGIADIPVTPSAKRYIHLFSLFLIYGSYLYLRLRKAKKDALRKAGRPVANA